MLVSVALLALVMSPLPELGSEPTETQIYGGEVVDSCGWPSVVQVSVNGGGSCTGTLVHPRVVITAAHCVVDGVPATVRFGETATAGHELANTEYCRQGPGWTGQTAAGEDYAYCRLASPVTSVPIIPVAAGCEQTAIIPGARIMHVGFGVDEQGQGGRKKMLDTTIDFVTNSGEMISGDFDEIICNGDSGGPAFVYLDPAVGGDGTWRVAAIHSWAQGADPVSPNCSGSAGSVLVSQAIDWIEQDSGIDITPCTDGAEWSPTAHCGGMATSPWEGEGNYTSAGCTHADVVEYAGICGPPLDANPDAIPPLVTFVTPTTQQEIMPTDGQASVEVELQATDEGWGVASVELTVRSLTAGAEQVDTRDEWSPWVWNTSLPLGSYELEAVAIDHAGNVSDPVRVCFGVGEPGCENDGEDETGTTGEDETGTAGEDETGTAGDTGGDEVGSSGGEGSTGDPELADDGGGGEGCGCRATDQGGGSPLLVLGGLLLWRRRRSARTGGIRSADRVVTS